MTNSSAPTIVLTGGTGGLGTALARRLMSQGARLAITYLVPEEATNFETSLSFDESQVLLRRVDSTSHEELTAFMKEAAEYFGGINGLCSLVGGWAGGRDLEDTTDVRFERMLDLNLRSAFYATRAALPHLRAADYGRIVLIGSRAAEDTPTGQAAFNAAKAGVVALAKTVAQELSGTNVTANVVMPSVIDTPATRATLPYSDYVKWPTPEEIAGVIEFLLSPDSGVTNGAAIPVYGDS